ncbi:MAG TPA: nitroreductase family protein [Candidatus Acetothermia bacterium]|nr:nitroreductase family protein [Candidatus Acetothermia bacterium]
MSTNSNCQVLRAIRDRRSTRDFLDTPVETAAISRIVDAGRLAASGANRQPWHFVVVDDPAIKHNLRSICEAAEERYYENANEKLRGWFAAHSISPSKPFLERAPVLIAVFFDPRAPYAIPSVWIAITHMLLQATQEGLYSLPYTPSGAQLGPELEVPAKYSVAALLPIGHAERPVGQPRHSLSQVASYNKYGVPFGDE